MKRDDVSVYPIPATKLAGENNFGNLANMILMGKILAELGEFDEEMVQKTLAEVIPPKKAQMLEINMKAMKLGASLK